MAYTKHTWAKGDVITSAKLNEMENGIAALNMAIVNGHMDYNTNHIVLENTFSEIQNYFNNGAIILIKIYDTGTNEITYITYVYAIDIYEENDKTYYIIMTKYFASASDIGEAYSTEEPDGYPSYDVGSV